MRINNYFFSRNNIADYLMFMTLCVMCLINDHSLVSLIVVLSPLTIWIGVVFFDSRLSFKKIDDVIYVRSGLNSEQIKIDELKTFNIYCYTSYGYGFYPEKKADINFYLQNGKSLNINFDMIIIEKVKEDFLKLVEKKFELISSKKEYQEGLMDDYLENQTFEYSRIKIS